MKNSTGMMSAACGLCLAAFAATAQASGIAQWDPRMALTAGASFGEQSEAASPSTNERVAEPELRPKE